MQASPAPASIDAYESAINAAFVDLTQAEADAAAAKVKLDAAQARIAELKRLIQQLAQVLPSERRLAVLGYANNLRPIEEPTTRGGLVFDNVVTLLRRSPRGSWNPSEIQDALQDRGIKADAKAIANILAYLAKNKMLKRIARGQYVLSDGSGIISAELDGLEDGTSRACEHD